MTEQGGKAESDGATRRRTETSIDTGSVVLISAMTVSIVPFVKSIATKAGEDAYQSVKRLLRKTVKPEKVGNIRILKLDDPSSNIHFHLSSVLSQSGAAQLLRLDLEDSRIHDGDILYYDEWKFFGQDHYLSWHDDRQEWVEQAPRELDILRDNTLRKIYNPARSHGLSTERITVALIPRAAEDLQRIQDRTGLSKTDIVNRAISLYEFINAELGAGRDVLIRDNDTGEISILHLL